MNRYALFAIALGLVALAVFLLLDDPEVQKPPPVQPPRVELVDPDAGPDLAPPPPPATRLVDAAPVIDDDDPAPDAAAEAGPLRYDLGEHSILLSERDGRFLRVGLALVVDDAEARRSVARRRRQLIRMLYFLGSKRSADAAERPDAEARFRDDLGSRYRNVLRDLNLRDIEITRFEIERREMPAPDAGTP